MVRDLIEILWIVDAGKDQGSNSVRVLSGGELGEAHIEIDFRSSIVGQCAFIFCNGICIPAKESLIGSTRHIPVNARRAENPALPEELEIAARDA